MDPLEKIVNAKTFQNIHSVRLRRGAFQGKFSSCPLEEKRLSMLRKWGSLENWVWLFGWIFSVKTPREADTPPANLQQGVHAQCLWVHWTPVWITLSYMEWDSEMAGFLELLTSLFMFLFLPLARLPWLRAPYFLHRVLVLRAYILFSPANVSS